MLKQRAGVSESASPPGPRTCFPSLTSIWFSSIRMAQALLQLPTASAWLRLEKPVPEAHFQLALACKERMGCSPSGITYLRKSEPSHAGRIPLPQSRRHGKRRFLPHAPGLQRGVQEGLPSTPASPSPGTLSARSLSSPHLCPASPLGKGQPQPPHSHQVPQV